MVSGMTREPVYIDRLNEKEQFFNERFESGEFLQVCMLGLAAILLFGLACWGMGYSGGYAVPSMFDDQFTAANSQYPATMSDSLNQPL